VSRVGKRKLTSQYSQGTSAQVVQDGSQKLYFNKSGEKASFIGQRLSDNRKERGVATEGEMTKEEKQQVPSHVCTTHTTHTQTHSDPERGLSHSPLHDAEHDHGDSSTFEASTATHVFHATVRCLACSPS
jgi:hypothetical protein